MRLRILTAASAILIPGAVHAQVVGQTTAPALAPAVGQPAPAAEAGAAVSSLAGSAEAQSTAPAGSATANGEPPALGDIVVTAQKRSESLQRVPISVTALTGADLAARGVTTTMQLSGVVPGLNLRTTVGSFQPTVRGIGASGGGESPVSLYIDDVYLPQPREGIRDLNDIAQLTVLKGPQGTLFGRNATGGVIQITTLKPSHEFRAEVGTEIDNYATIKTDVYVTGGLTSRLAASVSAQYVYQGEGWGKDFTTGHDTYRTEGQYTVRAKLLYQPTDRTNITLIGDYLNRRYLGNEVQAYPGTIMQFSSGGPLRSVYDTLSGIDGQLNFRDGGISLTVDQSLSFARLLSISSYRENTSFFRFDVLPAPQTNFISQSYAPGHDFTQEIQLISPKGRFNWVTGVYYIHNFTSADPTIRTTTGPLAPLPTSTFMNITNGREITDSVAPFVQADWEFLPRTKLTAGIRYTYEKRDYAATNIVQRINGSSSVLVDRTDSLSVTKPSFRLGLDHQFTDDVLAYASFNRGFKSGGFNVSSASSAAYLPESLDAYETGLKTQFFDRRLRLNAAAYYYQYTNIQVTQFNSGIQTLTNGAGAHLYGLDIDFQASFVRGLLLSGGIELAHAVFTDYRNAVFSAPKPSGGATVFFGDATGKRIPLSQNVSGNLALTYHRDVAGAGVDFNVIGSYNGAYYFEADNFLRQNAYVILNSSIGLTLPGGRFNVSVFGRNLLDRHVITQSSTATTGYSAVYGQAPRTYGVAARIHF